MNWECLFSEKYKKGTDETYHTSMMRTHSNDDDDNNMKQNAVIFIVIEIDIIRMITNFFSKNIECDLLHGKHL